MASLKMDFSKLLESIDKVTKKTYEDDSANYWKPTKDKSGSASARIRFLPSKDITDIPYVRLFSHSFKDPVTSRWYFENSLTTLGGVDEISIQNKMLWDTGVKANRDLVSLRKRKGHYISNILIITDAGNPENNGKVMRYKFGQKIFDKIAAAAKPEALMDEKPFNAFDPIDGADFILKMVLANDQYNYDQSKFASPKPMCDNDEDKIQAILDQCFDIKEEVAPSKFKSPEELKRKFLWVTGQDAPKVANAYDKEIESLTTQAKAAPKNVEMEERKKPPLPVMKADEDDEDFFKSLIES